MNASAWLSAAASLLLAGSMAPALAQAAPPPPAEVRSAPSGSPRPGSGAPKQPSGGQKSPRSTQPTSPRTKPNTSYVYCRGVARYMGLRGAERRKTILDCQLGVVPKISKG